MSTLISITVKLGSVQFRKNETLCPNLRTLLAYLIKTFLQKMYGVYGSHIINIIRRIFICSTIKQWQLFAFTT